MLKEHIFIINLDNARAHPCLTNTSRVLTGPAVGGSVSLEYRGATLQLYLTLYLEYTLTHLPYVALTRGAEKTIKEIYFKQIFLFFKHEYYSACTHCEKYSLILN